MATRVEGERFGTRHGKRETNRLRGERCVEDAGVRVAQQRKAPKSKSPILANQSPTVGQTFSSPKGAEFVVSSPPATACADIAG